MVHAPPGHREQPLAREYLLSGATISISGSAPTIGYANGPYWTFSPAPSTPVTLTTKAL